MTQPNANEESENVPEPIFSQQFLNLIIENNLDGLTVPARRLPQIVPPITSSRRRFHTQQYNSYKQQQELNSLQEVIRF